MLEGINGVAMAAVIGVADDLYQEVGHAFIVPDGSRELDSDTLRQATKAELANYKVPKTFTIAVDLPLLPVGKIDKKSLAAISRKLTRESSS